MKLVVGIITFIILLIVGAAVFVAGHLNTLVEDGVETVGPKITKTSVSLDSVDISLLKGGGKLNGFVLGNPKGFDSPHAMKTDIFSMKVNPLALRNEVVGVDELIIQGVEIVVEQKGLNTNIQSLLKTLSSSSKSPQSTAEASEGGDVRLALDYLKFSDSSIKLLTEKYGEYKLDMPSFELKNIGDPATGLTPEEFGTEILTSLLKQAQKTAEDYVKKLAKDKFETEIEDKLEDELRKKAEEELGKDMTDKADKAIKDLKKLF